MDRLDVDQMLSELNAAQLGEQLAFDELEPAGGLREDLRFARLICAVVNGNPYRARSTPLTPSEVFATLAEKTPTRRQNVHAVVAQRRRYIEAHNAAIAKGTMKKRRGRRH